MSIDPLTIVEEASVAIQLVGEVLKAFFPEADQATVLRFASQKLPTLLASPKEELSGYNAARNMAVSAAEQAGADEVLVPPARPSER